MPVADKYTEFAFTYSVPRVGLGGLSGVGQAMAAVTRHIFYVPADDAETFAALFAVTEETPETPETPEATE